MRLGFTEIVKPAVVSSDSARIAHPARMYIPKMWCRFNNACCMQNTLNTYCKLQGFLPRKFHFQKVPFAVGFRIKISFCSKILNTGFFDMLVLLKKRKGLLENT